MIRAILLIALLKQYPLICHSIESVRIRALVLKEIVGYLFGYYVDYIMYLSTVNNVCVEEL